MNDKTESIYFLNSKKRVIKQAVSKSLNTKKTVSGIIVLKDINDS